MHFPTLRAGQAVMFSHGVIHASLPNESRGPRAAFLFAVVGQGVQTVHSMFVARREPSSFERFSVDHRFVLRYTNTELTAMYEKGEKPGGATSLGIEEFRPTQISEAEMVTMLEQKGLVQNPELFARFVVPPGSGTPV